MKSMLLAASLGATLALAGTANAAVDAKKAEGLAKSNNCLACHAVDKKKKGPAYKSVAAKFKGDAGAKDKIIGKLKGGTDHPEVKASDADLATIVEWVLSLK